MNHSIPASGFHTFGTRLLPALVLAVALPVAARAQSTGNGFLFGAPMGSLTIRGGYANASAGSDLFAFSTDQLTLNRRDFSSPTVDIDLAFRTGARTDVVFGGSFAGTSKGSEFRHFVDQNNAAVRQNTTFQRVPLTISLRHYLTSRGRSVGNFAWVPARFTPFVGLGGGATWYRFRQSGDFIDFKTNNVFPSTLESSGWAPTARAMAGADYTLSPRLALTGQETYLWAKGGLSNDFSGFHRIDLSGLSTTLGLSVRF